MSYLVTACLIVLVANVVAGRLGKARASRVVFALSVASPVLLGSGFLLVSLVDGHESVDSLAFGVGWGLVILVPVVAGACAISLLGQFLGAFTRADFLDEPEGN